MEAERALLVGDVSVKDFTEGKLKHLSRLLNILRTNLGGSKSMSELSSKVFNYIIFALILL